LRLAHTSCENCREIDSVWEALAEEFAGDERFVIGEVDCSGSGKKLCEDEYVETYPSLKYGDYDMYLDDYNGKTDLDTLKAFTQEKVKLKCSHMHESFCNAEEKEMLDRIKTMSKSELAEKIEEMNAAVERKYDEVEQKVDAADKAVSAAEFDLERAEKSEDGERVREAEEEVERAKRVLEEAEKIFDMHMEEDEPLELTMMEDWEDELNDLPM